MPPQIELRVDLNPITSVQVTGELSTEVIKEIAFWQSLPIQCPVCQTALIFTFREPKPKCAYYGLKCTGSPAHEVDLHEYADDSGLYFKEGDLWQIEYKARANGNGANRLKPEAAALTPEQEDKQLDREIIKARDLLGRKDSHINDWTQKAWQSDCPWPQLSIEYKRKLRDKINSEVEKAGLGKQAAK